MGSPEGEEKGEELSYSREKEYDSGCTSWVVEGVCRNNILEHRD
jgi:hypothetical protein